jgi:magnesium-transporting ATPase (P-type)
MKYLSILPFSSDLSFSVRPPLLLLTVQEARPWHEKTIPEILRELNTSDKGLTPQAAASLLQRYGLNQLDKEPRMGPIKRFLLQFTNLLLILLLISSTITLALGLSSSVELFLRPVTLTAFVLWFLSGEIVEGLSILVTCFFNAFIATYMGTDSLFFLIYCFVLFSSSRHFFL